MQVTNDRKEITMKDKIWKWLYKQDSLMENIPLSMGLYIERKAYETMWSMR